jgi:hypothetical protein
MIGGGGRGGSRNGHNKNSEEETVEEDFLDDNDKTVTAWCSGSRQKRLYVIKDIFSFYYDTA